MKSKETLAIEAVQEKYYYPSHEDQLTERGFIKGFNKALEVVKAIYEKDGLAAVEKYVKKELK